MEFDDSSNTVTHGRAQTDERTWQFRALTDLWTGSVDRKRDRLITTGLLGSIRWWFEVLVRGLGGSTCDPTDTKCEDRNHCVVCELFGCTGWARKFRFDVLDENGEIRKRQDGGNEKISPQIVKDEKFTLRFIPLRPIRTEEWTLLDATLRLIAEYGAIGGKTVFKPSDEPVRQGETHHQDFGLIELLKGDLSRQRVDIARLKDYVREEQRKESEQKRKKGDSTWASLKYFWFIDGKTLSRENVNESTFNRVLGRKESKVCRDCGKVHNPPQKCQKTSRHPKRHSEHLVNDNDTISKWLAGSQQESKKVFSFKKPKRTFGFVKPELIDLAEMKTRLLNAWPDLRDGEFREGPAILDNLLSKDDHS